jgi:hypothetical protein
MARRRPTVVLVFGILNIVFGAIGFLCLGLGAIGMVAAGQLAKGIPGADPLEQIQRMNREIPGYTAILTAQIGCQLLLTLVLLASGIGLLFMKPWARWAAILFSWATIVLSLAGLVFSLAVVNPTQQRVQAQMLNEMRIRNPGNLGGPGTPPPMGALDPKSQEIIGAASAILGAVISVGYALALLLALSGRSVAAAFASQPPRRRRLDRERELEEEEDEDEG